MKRNSLFKKSSKKSSASAKSGAKKDSRIGKEISGLLLFAGGVLFFLALLTYHQADITWGSQVAGNRYVVKNFLGIIGATIAKPVFEYTFGYASLIFPFLVMLFGIRMVINYPLYKLVRLSFLSLAWGYFMAVVLAMPESLATYGQSVDYYPSGLLGGLTTDGIISYLGKFALGFLSGIYFVILLMITFDFRLSVLPIYFEQFRLWIAAKLRRIKYRLVKTIKAVSRWVNEVQWFRPKSRNKHVPESIYTQQEDSSAEPPLVEGEAEPGPVVAALEDDRVVDFSGIEEEGNGRHASSYSSLDDEEIITNAAGFEVPDDYPQPVSPYPESRIDGESAQQFPESEEYRDPIAPNPFGQRDLEFVEMPEEDIEAQIQESLSKYQMPPLELLHNDDQDNKVSREELMANADLLESTLAQFGVKAFVKKVIEGPVITLYAVRPAEGVKINQVVSLTDDLALAMRAKGIRMIAPIPGEAAIGIEIPNRRPSVVYFKSIIGSEKFINFRGQLVLGMGKTIGGDVYCADLTKMPHLLIAGSTGSGKSVGINTIIASILYRVPPSDVKFVLIDPKKLELSLYAKLKDHYLAYCPEVDEIVVTHPQNAILILRAVVNEMEERYEILSQVGVRDIISYNQKIDKLQPLDEQGKKFRKLPYIVVVIDELADLILTASREVEEPITRLAQMARAVGIHLIVATQRPSVDILTGLIKANFPTRIAFQVATRPDSKVILDQYGAEKLIGNGDMLFLPPGTGKPVRLQNPFISTEEVEAMIKHIRKQPKFPPYELKLVRRREIASPEATRRMNQDDLFEKAREIVIRHQQGSISLLQRKLKVGYARAARLIDELEEAGVVGPGQGSKARDVLISGYTEE